MPPTISDPLSNFTLAQHQQSDVAIAGIPDKCNSQSGIEQREDAADKMYATEEKLCALSITELFFKENYPLPG